MYLLIFYSSILSILTTQLTTHKLHIQVITLIQLNHFHLVFQSDRANPKSESDPRIRIGFGLQFSQSESFVSDRIRIGLLLNPNRQIRTDRVDPKILIG